MTSVIIPTSNEAQYLSATLEAIAAAGVDVCHEVVVVDANSNDPTPTIASAHGARGDVLLFLHGDTLLPAQALEKIERVMQDRRVVGGAFARRYDSHSPLLRVTCAVAGVRARICGWFLGDQAIFVRAELFRNWAVFEISICSRTSTSPAACAAQAEW